MKLLPTHRAHDAQHLIQRWIALAERVGCHIQTLCRVGESQLPILALETPAARRGEAAIYLSSGVHGDEAGSAWGLLLWAEKHADLLAQKAFFIAPCINPVGLILNTRADGDGVDLNRRFHDAAHPLCGAWQRWITGRPMRFALCLHEDYDAQGLYLYELNNVHPMLGRRILSRCADLIEPDPRSNIDGQDADAGVILRRELPTHLPGMPEAIELQLRGCPLTLTFESPSEFGLDVRVQAQVRFIESAIDILSSVSC